MSSLISAIIVTYFVLNKIIILKLLHNEQKRIII